jgi:hypothetical protein
MTGIIMVFEMTRNDLFAKSEDHVAVSSRRARAGPQVVEDSRFIVQRLFGRTTEARPGRHRGDGGR